MPAAKKPAALVPSAASAWGDEPDQKEHTLPTGRVMTLRRGPAMRRLVMAGVIPSTLIGVELVPVEGGDPGERSVAINSKLFEEQRAAVVCAMSVQPPIVMQPLDDGEALLYDRLDEMEIEYIIALAQEGSAGTARFLVESSGDADGAGGEVLGEGAE